MVVKESRKIRRRSGDVANPLMHSNMKILDKPLAIVADRMRSAASVYLADEVPRNEAELIVEDDWARIAFHLLVVSSIFKVSSCVELKT